LTALDFFARWRVRLGYILTVIVFCLARPTPRSIAIGAVVGALGLSVRAYAAGYLHKQQVLTTTGPYARTRNPLYFGSSILTLGAAIAMNSWFSAAVLLIYFALVYTLVMRREETEMRQQHGAAFDAYAAAVPLFFPSLFTSRALNANAAAPSPSEPARQATFSWSQYKKNREYRATLGFLLLLIGLVVIWRLRL
jgi:protein-S-isoprenylcysteine O-methyltransferase Ste14